MARAIFTLRRLPARFYAAKAAEIAANFVVECIKATAGDHNHKYGAKFEKVLGKLICAVDAITK